MAEALTSGLELIAQERARQVNVENWTPEYDDQQHDGGQLAMAAYCYEWSARTQIVPDSPRLCLTPPPGWPWSKDWWKPKTPVKDLVRAGALYMAELDRCTRAASRGDIHANMGSAKMAQSLVCRIADEIDVLQARGIS